MVKRRSVLDWIVIGFSWVEFVKRRRMRKYLSNIRRDHAEREEVRKIFGVTHALETFGDYQSINRQENLLVFSPSSRIIRWSSSLRATRVRADPSRFLKTFSTVNIVVSDPSVKPSVIKPDRCPLMNYDRKVQLALFLTRTEIFLFRSTDDLSEESCREFDTVRGQRCHWSGDKFFVFTVGLGGESQ